MEVRQRFYRHVVAGQSDCHIWVGCKDRKGYGRFLYNGQAQMAHRVALLIAGRQLPSGSRECAKLGTRKRRIQTGE